jgi:predicted HicB family RNase H-like nuclease
MNTMNYKGYTAKVELDERDDIFVGRILGISTMISFHGTTVAQLREEFRIAVDDYLEECEASGTPPEKAASGKFLLRMPPDLHSKAIVLAQASGKSMNQWMLDTLQKELCDEVT